jgi:hypothetical protein
MGSKEGFSEDKLRLSLKEPVTLTKNSLGKMVVGPNQ